MSFIKDWYVKHLNKKVEYYWNIYHFNMNPNHTSYNNEGDAFKHCYFQAELTLFLGRLIANFIGLKHEDRPDNPPKEKGMDLHNNTVGQQIGKEIKSSNLLWFFSNWQDLIAQKIMKAMQDGLLITEIEEASCYSCVYLVVNEDGECHCTNLGMYINDLEPICEDYIREEYDE